MEGTCDEAGAVERAGGEPHSEFTRFRFKSKSACGQSAHPGAHAAFIRSARSRSWIGIARGHRVDNNVSVGFTARHEQLLLAHD